MMNKEQALAYGEKIGVRYLVKNSNDGLLGGSVTLAGAEEIKAKAEREYAADPFGGAGLAVHILDLAGGEPVRQETASGCREGNGR